jgi:3-oxoacyl-[acyl-carrier protein] reductase
MDAEKALFGKILLLTGASSDIGLSLIRRLAARYDAVLAHYGRSEARILALREELGEKIVPLGADFSKADETSALAESIVGQGWAPEHFVHLPALPFANGRIAKTGWPEYAAQLDVQLRSAVVLCRALLPAMAEQKRGKILFMLTDNVAKSVPVKYAAAYTTAKYALLGFMKCLSAEYADKGIAVNAVSTSMIDTRFNAGHPELVREMNAEASPLKRNLAVQDVVPAFEFLLSPGADAIRGQNHMIGSF